MFNFDELTNSVADGQVDKAAELTQKALAAQVPAKEILDKGLLPAMNLVGRDFESGQIFLPELLMAGDAMKASIVLLRPELSSTGAAYAGKYVIGTVEGDLHDIGKNIVIMMLEGNGWEVTDLGRDIPPQRFCEEIEKGSYDILGLSALLTFTMPKMPETINVLKEAGLRNKVKVMVGGVPLNQSFADQIGADAYARDAVEAVIKAKELLNK
ncbi:MAG TPA: cobalamin-binding protein [Dehalococcoidia bacterium]|nr:cobalamin-binding protein [Dehalococcoidia bacterium]